jgi:lysozyme family protein
MRQEDSRPDDQVQAVDLGDGAGLTKYGLSQRANPDLDIANLTASQAVKIYQKKYWDVLNAENLPLPIAVALFDASVNHGPKTAIRILQEAVGVPTDGVIGPITMDAAQRNPWRLLRKFIARRGVRYAGLDNFSKFGHVWLERLNESYAYCLALPD